MTTGNIFQQQLSRPLVSADGVDDLNPYSPPVLVQEPVHPLLPADQWHLLNIQVVNAQRYALRRRVVLAGDIDAEIFYDGWVPNELVSVNGRRRFRAGPLYFSIVCPMIFFELETASHRVPALVEARATFSWRTLFRLNQFRITVGDRLIYADDGA